MRALLVLTALASATSGALAAERALHRADTPAPGLSIDAGRPLFELAGLRHGDRAERCVTLTNEGPGDAKAEVLGRTEGGDLAPHLRLVVARGCEEDRTLLFSGRLSDFAAAPDPETWPQGARRRYALAVEVASSDHEIQARRAVQEFGFTAEHAEERKAFTPPAPVAVSAPSVDLPRPTTCTSIRFAKTTGGRRKHPVLIKYHRVSRRVQAKLILRIYGAIGHQRLVLVTGLRHGRDEVVMGRRWGRVTYRVTDGAPVSTRTRPYRVRIAPGVLKPGRNLVRVTTFPRRGRIVRARYVLNIEALAIGERTECRIG